MANTVNSQTILDGPRNAVIKVYVASDGVTGELSDQVVVDISALSGAPTTVRLEKVQWVFSGFTGTLEWDATTDVPIIGLSDNTDGCQDFTCFGGIPNDGGSGVTGDILLSTSGFTASGDAGHIVLYVSK